MALILLTGTVAAIVVRVPESYPWWYTVWVAITGGTATGTIAWLTAVIYTIYEELNIMVLSHIVRERDRKAAEARERDAEAREQDIDAREQEVDARQQEVDAQQQEVAEREQASRVWLSICLQSTGPSLSALPVTGRRRRKGNSHQNGNSG